MVCSSLSLTLRPLVGALTPHPSLIPHTSQLLDLSPFTLTFDPLPLDPVHVAPCHELQLLEAELLRPAHTAVTVGGDLPARGAEPAWSCTLP